MTDVTGFRPARPPGGNGRRQQAPTARVEYAAVPRLASAEYYLEQGCVPGGTLQQLRQLWRAHRATAGGAELLLCDPQTSGGLLVAVAPEGEAEFLAVAAELGLQLAPIGELVERLSLAVQVL